MRVIKPLRLSYLGRPYRYLKKNYFTITAIVHVDYKDGFKLKTEQELWSFFRDEIAAKFKGEAIDVGIRKPQPEILVNGYGFGKYAVDGKTAVSVQVNNVRKDLWVNGDRYWLNGEISKPQPFDQIPIAWTHAYGGPDYPLNPVGRGREGQQIGDTNVVLLPNIESPHDPIRQQNKEYSPVGYSSTSMEQPGKNLLLGSYDDKWREEEFPGFARDIDWSYFNQALPDQRLSSLSIGDEITFINLHPEKSNLKTVIPPILVKAFIKKSLNDSEHDFLEEVGLDLRTYWAFPHLEQAYLVYQGTIPVVEFDDADISHLLFAIEHADKPQNNAAYYESIFHKRIGKQANPLYSMLDKDLVDEEFLGGDAALTVSNNSFLVKTEKNIQNRTERLKRRFVRKGYIKDEEELEKLRADSDVKIADMDNLSKLFQSDTVSLEDVLEELEQHQKNIPSVLEVARQNKKNKKKLESSSPSKKYKIEEGGDELEFFKKRRHSFKEEKEAQGAFSIDGYKDGIASEYLDSFKSELDEKEQRFFNDNLNLLRSPSQIDINHLEQHISIRYRSLQEAINHQGNEVYLVEDIECNAISESKIKLSGGVFDRVVFDGCDFKASTFEKVRFKNCHFTRCNLDELTLSEVTFMDCQFEFTSLNNCFLQGVQTIDNCVFSHCSLKEWTPSRIVINNLKFQNCKFEQYIFLRVLASELSFDQCEFLRCSFITGRYQGVYFNKCTVDSMAFAKINKLVGLRVNESSLDKFCIAPGMKVSGVSITSTSVIHSGFRGTVLEGLEIRDSQLHNSDFSAVSMQSARLQNSSLKESLFVRVDLTAAHIERVDLSYCFMKAAILNSTFLKRVSFFSTELGLIQTNKDTVQIDCLVERANFIPRLEKSDV